MISSVPPSGAAFLTATTPMRPAAPVRLSTTDRTAQRAKLDREAAQFQGRIDRLVAALADGGVPLDEIRPRLAAEDWPGYGRKLTALAERMASFGVAMAFHHHMGTIVETQREIDLLMSYTGKAVGLLLDTGHLTFAGGFR